MAQLKQKYPEDVRVVYRHFPLASIHDKAILSTQAAEAAGLQDMFWEMHDLLYAEFPNWNDLSVDDFKVWLTEDAAVKLGLDVDQFAEDLDSDAIVAFAEGTWTSGQQIGLPGTPFVTINSAPYQGPMDIGNLSSIVEIIKMEGIQYAECPDMKIDPLKNYYATINTDNGSIVLELYADIAPIAVNNFVFLAENGWYDNVTFHRVLPGFMAQGGDPSGTGLGGPGYNFINETDPDITFDRAGLVAMANSGPDTNGSQFFITYAPASHLDGGYTIFGEVIEGMDVVESLSPRDPSQSNVLPPGDLIISVEIEER